MYSKRKKGSGPAWNLFGLEYLTIFVLLFMAPEKICSVEVKRASIAIQTSPCLIHWTSELYFKGRLQSCYSKKQAVKQTLTVNTNVHERCSGMLTLCPLSVLTHAQKPSGRLRPHNIIKSVKVNSYDIPIYYI
ncbi:uncharacterized protein LOC110460661 [Mizuhopecten yessoensis]|uniref:uncharacterized protein LOC110460661 n=1 Tax=Mizuhopecten yessoensis TaxID=6573 RepID=UPI000B45DB31|nr:uncharacterized protein LOC110460661 [Mizuhopecten yessoensis]